MTRRKKQFRMDVEDKAVAKKLIRRGQSFEAIAVAFDVNWLTIRRIAKDMENNDRMNAA